MEKELVSELLDALTAVHSFLAKDLSKDKLSSKNQKSRQSYIQQLDSLIKKLQEANTQPPPLASKPAPSPPVQQRPAPQMRPPPPPIADEGGEVYEVPDSNPNPSEYSDFLPVTLQDDPPQEDYLPMEANEREEITEETYEDPSQTNDQEPEPELYEDPQAPFEPPQTHPPQQSKPDSTGGGYMEPVRLSTSEVDKRASVVPTELIDDWECAYEASNVNKKKEKVKASKLKNIAMKGWLEKLGGRSHKNWQKRYCVLSEMFMYFYEKESSSTYNNRIPIPGFVPNPSNELTVPKKNQYAFKLSSTDSSGRAKDYYFRSKVEAERDQWVESIRNIFDQGRIAIERKKSQTLPVSLSSTRIDVSTRPPDIEEFEQENYEPITAAMIPEEDEDDQEEYMDVSQNKETINEDVDQEEYVAVEQEGEEPQEDYVEPQEFRQNLNRNVTSPPVPPSPARSSNTTSVTKLPLPPPPAPPTENTTPNISHGSVTKQPLPAPPPAQQQRPDPVVDTNKTYTQSQNGIQYNKVYVMMWDFHGVDSDEVKVQRGDLLFVTNPNEGQEWWYGELLTEDCSRKTGQAGLFPANYSTLAFEVVQ